MDLNCLQSLTFFRGTSLSFLKQSLVANILLVISDTTSYTNSLDLELHLSLQNASVWVFVIHYILGRVRKNSKQRQYKNVYSVSILDAHVVSSALHRVPRL